MGLDNGTKKFISIALASQGALNIAILGWLYVVTGKMGDRFTGTQGNDLKVNVSNLNSNQQEMMRRIAILESKEPISQEVLRRLLNIEVTTKELAREFYRVSSSFDTALGRMEERLKAFESKIGERK